MELLERVDDRPAALGRAVCEEVFEGSSFGAWAATAGLLQLAGALRAGPWRAQLALIISGE